MRPARIELASRPWQGRILPLNHGRAFLPPRGFEPLTLSGRRPKRRAYSSSATEALRPRRESNPRIRDLQSLALPLGYAAIYLFLTFSSKFSRAADLSPPYKTNLISGINCRREREAMYLRALFSSRFML